MKWVIDNIKCRVNEEEGPLLGGDRSGKYVKTRSSSCKKTEPEDMLQYTMRIKESFFTEFE